MNPPASNNAIYSQCPTCRTVFRVTLEQLQARDGLVRCGQCQHVFRADQHLYSELAVQAPTKSKPSATRETAASKKPPKAKSKPPAARSAVGAAPTTPEVIDIIAAPPPWQGVPEISATASVQHEPAPAIEKPAPRPEKRPAKRRRKQRQAASTLLPEAPARPRAASAWWIAGSIVLTLGLAAQVTYFYRDELADYPELQPFIVDACEQLGCSIRPYVDVARIELVEPTGIAPHPRAANALRLRATLVNRALRPQPYPLMQITLTDNAGRALARRTFAPKEYLEAREPVSMQMEPNLAIGALLDIANPDGKAVGYQIDFLPPASR